MGRCKNQTWGWPNKISHVPRPIPTGLYVTLKRVGDEARIKSYCSVLTGPQAIKI